MLNINYISSVGDGSRSATLYPNCIITIDSTVNCYFPSFSQRVTGKMLLMNIFQPEIRGYGASPKN